jgi:hypothetical protein
VHTLQYGSQSLGEHRGKCEGIDRKRKIFLRDNSIFLYKSYLRHVFYLLIPKKFYEEKP